MRDLATLPKAELHIHLEGSIRVATVRDLAGRRGVAPPSGLCADGIWRFADAAHFIDQYGAVCNLLHDLDEFHRIAFELCQDLSGQGVYGCGNPLMFDGARSDFSVLEACPPAGSTATLSAAILVASRTLPIPPSGRVAPAVARDRFSPGRSWANDQNAVAGTPSRRWTGFQGRW